ncbi:MAG: AAA family ATPase [Flavobacteriales bacterium]|nr:AAA family ATPase [Flavobacteriales bacterium]
MEDLIASLKEALEHSPQNIPLRLQLAKLLLNATNYSEAEHHFKEVLMHAPGEVQAKAGLARASYYQDKHGVALVIFEELIAGNHHDPSLLVLYSKCLIAEGNQAKASEMYRQALMLDPAVQDSELDGQLRMAAGVPELDAIEDELNAELLSKEVVKFSDVGGMEHVKEEISLKIIHPLKHPELYKAYGKKTGGGILLYGPPGCGKTFLAKATAGEIDARFMPVGINDILDMWIGNSEKNLHDMFETARRVKPCVVFFDEVDALGASRQDMRQSAGRHLINQFLSELDGMESDNEGLLILGATNAPWHLDPAFRRPGRFDRIIFVQPPDEEGRKAILMLMLREKPLENVDFGAVARKTAEFSGADLQAVVDICIEQKLSESFKTGVPEPIRTKDLLAAAKRVKPSTREWFNTAKNYALYSNESGLYDDILNYLKIKK